MIEGAKKRMDMNLARLSRSSRFDTLQVSSGNYFIEIEVFVSLTSCFDIHGFSNSSVAGKAIRPPGG
jgi:hypothetical protein